MGSRTQDALIPSDEHGDPEHGAELLIEAVSEAARLLDCDGAMVYLVDESVGDLHFGYDAGVTDPDARALLRGLRLPLGSGMFGTAMARGELAVTNDYRADTQFAHHTVADEIVERVGIRSMAAAPMVANGKPLGVLGAYCNKPHAFNAHELSLLKSLAGHAAAAIGNRRLLAELSASEEQLRTQAAELERALVAQRAVDEISRQMVDVADSSEVLQQIVDLASNLLGSDGAHLTYLNEAGTDLIPMVMAGKTDPSVREWLHSQRYPLGGGINGLAATTGKPIWTDDYANDPRIPHDPEDESPARLELGAVSVAPLRGQGGDVVGTLALTYREPRQIDPRDVALLDELARQASIAGRNSRLYSELRQRTAELEHELNERERLEDDLRRNTAELAANEERARIARELHDSVTQALFSMGLTLRTAEILLDRDPAAARQKLGELQELQNDALTEMRTLIFELRPRSLETDGLAQALRNHAAAITSRTGLNVTVDVSLEERLEPGTEQALYRIGQEALHNVVKHANASSADVTLARVGNTARLVVDDDGVGFDPEIVSRGTLGLVGMRQRAEQLGGAVHIEARPGGGTRVEASVPIEDPASAV